MSSSTTAATVRERLWPEQSPAPCSPWWSMVGFQGATQEEVKNSGDWFSIPRTHHQICEVELPSALFYLVNPIEKSRWMLQLEDDWDDAGSPGYSQHTWNQAVRFLLKSTIELWRKTDRRIPSPEIQNGPEGSIDLFWETEVFTLLINIPPGNEQASYYGSKSNGYETKGTLDACQPNSWLLVWTLG